MKTKLMLRGLFSNTIKELGNLTKIELVVFEEFFKVFVEEGCPVEMSSDDFIVGISEKYNVTINSLIDAVSYIFTILHALEDNNDRLEDFIKDITSEEIFEKEQANDIKQLLELAKKTIYDETRKTHRKTEAIKSSFPILKGAKTSIVQLMDFEPDFDSTTDELSTYNPRLFNRYNLVVLKMSTDMFGKRKSYQITLSEKTLSFLINDLQAAYKQLKSLAVKPNN